MIVRRKSGTNHLACRRTFSRNSICSLSLSLSLAHPSETSQENHCPRFAQHHRNTSLEYFSQHSDVVQRISCLSLWFCTHSSPGTQYNGGFALNHCHKFWQHEAMQRAFSYCNAENWLKTASDAEFCSHHAFTILSIFRNPIISKGWGGMDESFAFVWSLQSQPDQV